MFENMASACRCPVCQYGRLAVNIWKEECKALARKWENHSFASIIFDPPTDIWERDVAVFLMLARHDIYLQRVVEYR